MNDVEVFEGFLALVLIALLVFLTIALAMTL